MVAEHLTIRNNTSTPLVLKRIECFGAPHKRAENDIASLAKNFTRVLTNQTRSNDTVEAIDNDTSAFDDQNDIDLQIEPFTTQNTDLRAYQDSEKERLRLTFEAEGEQHQVQAPVPSADAATMKALSDEPKFQFTGIYVASESYLTIFSSANPQAWMHDLRDDVLLSSLSIPGTHNSPTCHVAPPSVRCQAVSPREQLNNGVRFFDIRVQPQNPDDTNRDELALVHSVFPISLTGTKYFRDLMNEVNEFLDQNPSEVLIISLKREGPGDATDEQLSRILRDHYATSDSRWWVEPRIPTLGEARGKVVLVRRFNLLEEMKSEHDGNGWGIDAAAWADNTANATCPTGHICIQDFYEVQETTNIDEKIQYVKEHIDRASANQYPFGELADAGAASSYPFYINFLSASNFWKTDTWPEKIAAKVNPAAVDYICRRGKDEDGDCSTGILVTDWVGLDGNWDLARAIVGMNGKLRMREN